MAKKVLSLMLFLLLILALMACAPESETPSENDVPAEPTAEESGDQEQATPDIAPTEAAEGEGQEARPEGEVPVFTPSLALTAAITYLTEQDPELAIPEVDLWEESVQSSEPPVLGSSTFLYSTGEWEASVQFPIVLPELTIYTVEITNEALDFSWQGEIDAYGEVTELQ